MLTPGADPVGKVSIIPRGQALGVTFSAPDRDRLSYAEQDLVARIRVALGGGRVLASPREGRDDQHPGESGGPSGHEDA
jgi:hypothetical protein